MSLATVGHAPNNPLTNDNKVEGINGKLKFPFKLCRGMHLTYHCSRMEEALQLLESNVIS